MKAIKSFIYLDEYKMYSLSSQVFEGITEYLISSENKTTEESESQKGPITSGRVLADIVKKTSQTEEKRLLHDHSYHLFEQHLIDEKRVYVVQGDSPIEDNDIEKNPFIKIKAKATFNDINSLKDMISKYNEIGAAFTYVTNINSLNEVKEQLAALQSTIKDKNQVAQLKAKAAQLSNIKDMAKKSGLHYDDRFLKELTYLLTYGYQDQFEIQLSKGESIFSAGLKREFLRESENLLVRKYARTTQKEFVLFGIIAQSATSTDKTEEEEKEVTNIKQGILNLVNALAVVESHFTGRLSNEFIIDPIAVYTEL